MLEFHKSDPEKPLMISEWGAGSDVRIHREEPRRLDFSEEWQCRYMEAYMDAFEELPWLCGVTWWVFADFGSATRGDSIPHVNQKGVVTFDRKIKKDAFYLMKSRWSSDPVCYLVSPHYTERSGAPQKTYRVYSNCDSVELFHNGQSLGVQKERFQWQVSLQEGANELKAVGTHKQGKLDHGFTVDYTRSAESEKDQPQS